MTKFSDKKFILLIFLILLVFGVLVVFVFDVDCLFKSIFGIACPGCGLTRGFRALFHVDLKEAFFYNILTIPIFLFLVIFLVLFVIDILCNRDFVSRYLLFFSKYYYILIVLVMVSFVFNNVRGI